MTTEEFTLELKEKTRIAEKIVCDQFENYLAGRENAYVKIVLDAMDYSLLAGGKRLRPLLMREVFHVLTEGNESLEQERALEIFMTAMEMIHTYSLVHDDLPAMDNDMYRRGKETTWKVYGDGMGLLTGEALLNAAFELVFQYIDDTVRQGKEDITLWRQLTYCGRILTGKACVDGMLGGQVADVQSEKEGLKMTQERILFIHVNKTAALIEASMAIGAILAGADESTVQTIITIARKIGVAFQIQDDILDVEGDSAELGKPVGSDAESGKETYVTLRGIEESKREVKRLSEEAIAELRGLPGDHAFLQELIEYLIYRKK